MHPVLVVGAALWTTGLFALFHKVTFSISAALFLQQPWEEGER